MQTLIIGEKRSSMIGEIMPYGIMRRSNSMRLVVMALSNKVGDHWHNCLLYIIEGNEALKLSDILIVCDFPNVFPEDLLGLAPHKEVDFSIELAPKMEPILEAPY